VKKTPLILILAVLTASPLVAGSIKGKVHCKGLRHSDDAVVYVDTIAGKTFPAPKAHAEVDQIDLTFKPHVLPVVVGTTIDFLNSDAVLHNVFSPDDCASKFNLGTWPQGQKKSQTFDKPCFAVLLCKVHPEMEAFVAVVPTPYYAVTAKDGSYEIKDVPDGSYTVKVWHPKLKGTSMSVTVAGDTTADFEIKK